MNGFARKLIKALNDIPAEGAALKRETEAKKRRHRDGAHPTPRTPDFDYPITLALQAIAIYLGLENDIQPDGLEKVAKKFSEDERARLLAITWQFDIYPTMADPPKELSQFLSGRAAGSEEREAYLQRAWRSWGLASKKQEMVREFISKADNIRVRCIQVYSPFFMVDAN